MSSCHHVVSAALHELVPIACILTWSGSDVCQEHFFWPCSVRVSYRGIMDSDATAHALWAYLVSGQLHWNDRDGCRNCDLAGGAAAFSGSDSAPGGVEFHQMSRNAGGSQSDPHIGVVFFFFCWQEMKKAEIGRKEEFWEVVITPSYLPPHSRLSVFNRCECASVDKDA